MIQTNLVPSELSPLCRLSLKFPAFRRATICGDRERFQPKLRTHAYTRVHTRTHCRQRLKARAADEQTRTINDGGGCALAGCDISALEEGEEVIPPSSPLYPPPPPRRKLHNLQIERYGFPASGVAGGYRRRRCRRAAYLERRTRLPGQTTPPPRRTR